MGGAAERMRLMRDRHRSMGLRELRLAIPDARATAVRQRIALQVAAISLQQEAAAMQWIEAVSEFDEPQGKPGHETR